MTLTGGNRSYVRLICETLGERCEFTVLTNWRPDAGQGIPHARLEFVTADATDGFAARAAFLARSMPAIARRRPDVVHAIGSRHPFAVAARFAGLITGSRILFESASPMSGLVGRLGFDALIGPSERVVRQFGPAARLMHRPIDIDSFQAAAVAPYSFGDGPPIVGAMAVPDHRHGLRELVEASGLLLAREPFRLVIAMPEEQARYEPDVAQGLQTIRRRVAELGLTDIVTWMGRVDPVRFFRSVDCFVFPAQTAIGMVDTPTTVLECLAASCPIVTTSVAAIPELGVAQAGEVLPPGREADPSLLAEAIRSLLRDPDRRRRIRATVPAAIRRHGKTRVMNRLFDLYQSLAGRPAAEGMS